MGAPLLTSRVVLPIAGPTYSPVIDLHDYWLTGILIPAAFTGTGLTFKGQTGVQVSAIAAPNLDTASLIYDETGNQVTITVAQGTYVGLSNSNAARILEAVPKLYIASNASEAAARELLLVLMPRR